MNRSLLRWGIIAGPFYVTVSLAQALTRDGFDISRHAWSLLSNGDLGWIQIGNFILTGLMVIAAAVGLKSRLIGIYGASLIGAGIFTADPAQGFPVGTPQDATEISWHGMLHFMVGGVGFLCLIAACILFARRFGQRQGHRASPRQEPAAPLGPVRPAGRRGLAWFSGVTGVAFLAAFAGIASGSRGPTTLAFVAAVLIVWTWLSTVSVHFYRHTTTQMGA